MAIPQKFRKSGDIALNIDSQDILTNTGYLILYASGINGRADGTSSNEYCLTNQQIIGAPRYLARTNFSTSDPHTTYRDAFDVNFDIPLSRPLLINGKFICNIANSASEDTATGNGRNKIIVNVYDFDGSTETLIFTDDNDYNSIDASIRSNVVTISGDIDNKLIPAGHTLRINVIAQLANGADNTLVTADIYMGTDPSNSSNGTQFPTSGHTLTQSAFYIPVKLGTIT